MRRRIILSIFETSGGVSRTLPLSLGFVVGAGIGKTAMGGNEYSSEYWLARAEEARTLAEIMKETAPKLTMLGIAKCYERLAQHAQAQAELMARIEMREQEKKPR